MLAMVDKSRWCEKWGSWVSTRFCSERGGVERSNGEKVDIAFPLYPLGNTAADADKGWPKEFDVGGEKKRGGGEVIM